MKLWQKIFCAWGLGLSLFLMVSACANLFQPNPTDPNFDIKTITDKATLMSLGEGAMTKSDWKRALACYNRVIALDPRHSQAKVNAMRASLLRDDAETFKTFGILLANPASPFAGLAGVLNSYNLYTTNGAIYLVKSYLTGTNYGSNWYLGDCDNVVPTNSFTPLLNLLYVDLLELPGLMLDLRRDYNYNNTNHLTNGGDLLVVDTGGTLTVNPTITYLSDKLTSLTGDIYYSSSSSKAYFLALDDELKALHDLLNTLLLGLQAVNLTARINQIDEIFVRLQSIPGTSSLSSIFSQMSAITGSLKNYITNSTIAPVAQGYTFNSLQSNLNGSFAFVSNNGIVSFVPSPWVSLSSSKVVGNTNSLQGVLKLTYTGYGY